MNHYTKIIRMDLEELAEFLLDLGYVYDAEDAAYYWDTPRGNSFGEDQREEALKDTIEWLKEEAK